MRLRRRYGRARATDIYRVGDSVAMVSPSGTAMGVVREVTPKRVLVWTGTTGFGQRRWPFNEKGEPVGNTKIAFPNLRLMPPHEAP